MKSSITQSTYSDKNGTWPNPISLNRAILRVMIVVAGVIVLFLGVLDAYWIQNYQVVLRSQWKSSLNEAADDVMNDLEALSSDLYDIYYYDLNFRELQSAQDIQSLPFAYELEDRLKTLLLLKQRAGGYVLFFDQLEKKRYYFSQPDFGNADVEKLKTVIEKLSEATGNIRKWYYVPVNQKVYAIGICQNNGVSLGEIYSLEDIRKDLEKKLSDVNAFVFFRNQNELLMPEDSDFPFRSQDVMVEGERNGWFFSSKTVSGTDLTIGIAVPMRIWTYMNAQQLAILIITAAVIVMSVFFYFRIRRELFRPLDHLNAEMVRIGGGDWSRGIQSRSRFSEIQQVIDTTDRMIEEIERQKLVAYEKTIQEQMARMQYLSLQLNPHFYLNNLKTLNVLAMQGKTDKIQDIIIHLSGYLRYLLQMEKDTVPLYQELNFVEQYVRLNREMTDRVIQFSAKVRPEDRNCMVPRLCIQTFVENSLKYTRPLSMQSGLELTITSSRFSSEEGDFLEIIVRDNGSGYPEEVLHVINDAPAEGTVSVGINNLKRRCEILYGGVVQYAFYNDNGAVSDIFYPWTESREETYEFADRG